MKIIFTILIFTLISCNMDNKKTNQNLEAPVATKIQKILNEHGTERIDNYFWMNERDSKEVLSYIEEENNYTKKVLQHTEKGQERLYEEIIGRIKQDDESVPFLENGYFYQTKYKPGKEYSMIFRRKGSLDSAEELLLDQNLLAEGHSYYALGGWAVSPHNKLLAYSEDTVSRRIYTMKVKNIETGEMLSENIKNTSGAAVWANDNEHFFYVVQEEGTLRDYRVYRHKLGDDPKNDMIVFEEKDEEYTVGIGKSKSGKYIFIASSQSISDEYRFIDADNPLSDPELIIPRKKGFEYDVIHHNDKFLVRTNQDAQNFKLVSINIGDNSLKNAIEIIPHREDVLLDGVEEFKDFLVVEERYGALNHIRIINQINGEDYEIEFPEDVYSSWVSVNEEYESSVLRVGYTSLTTPISTFDYNMNNRNMTLLKEQEVLGGFDKDNYQTERLWALARDGKKVPISVVYKKGFKKDGNAPLMLYGYGSYGITIDPTFSSDRLSLLDRGFAFAIAHIRGGEDLGRAWYEDGKMFNKKNTFTDFIDCAEYLISEKFTSSENIFAYGGSAGGLLMGAVTNMRPELWKGVVAAVPFVDVVSTMLDETIPLTTGEYDEWGNPNNKDSYEYMLSYSPYDQVEAKNYPNMLITTGYHDSQVQYWEPLKWTAKLRDYNTSENIILLNMLMEAGHGGASGRFRRYKEKALIYAYIFDILEIDF